jgi:PEP-CTERM motif
MKRALMLTLFVALTAVSASADSLGALAITGGGLTNTNFIAPGDHFWAFGGPDVILQARATNITNGVGAHSFVDLSSQISIGPTPQFTAAGYSCVPSMFDPFSNCGGLTITLAPGFTIPTFSSDPLAIYSAPFVLTGHIHAGPGCHPVTLGSNDPGCPGYDLYGSGILTVRYLPAIDFPTNYPVPTFAFDPDPPITILTPEPPTVTLLGLGLAGWLAVARSSLLGRRIPPPSRRALRSSKRLSAK